MGKWYVKFKTGKFRPGIAFIICRNQFHLPKKKPRTETGVKDGFEEIEHEFPFGIFRPKTGLPFQTLRCSRKVSTGTTQKVAFHLLLLNNKNGSDGNCSQCACFLLKIIKGILFGVSDLLQNLFVSGNIYRLREIT